MYDSRETDLSWAYLQEVIRAVQEPIVLLGGWSVYFLVNDKYKEFTGREYIGSRDVDLGFGLEDREIAGSPFVQCYETLTSKLGFIPQSYRLFKQVHAETGKLLGQEDAKDVPLHLISTIYVDMIVDSIPIGFQEKLGFTPIDEPLLKPILKHERNRMVLKVFGKAIWIPTPDMLIATKVKAYPNRDKEHKRLKDACDIVALLLFTQGINKEKLNEILGSGALPDFKNMITESELKEVSRIIAIYLTIIKSALLKII